MANDMAESKQTALALATGPNGQPWIPSGRRLLVYEGRHFKGRRKKAAASLLDKKLWRGKLVRWCVISNYPISSPTQLQTDGPPVYSAKPKWAHCRGLRLHLVQQAPFLRQPSGQPVSVPAR